MVRFSYGLAPLYPGLRLITPAMVDPFSVARTPQEYVGTIRTNPVEAEIDHVVMVATDPDLVGSGLPSCPVCGDDQPRLHRQRVIPPLADRI